MKQPLSVLLMLAATAGYAHAQNDVWLCVDSRGKKEYKNTGATKGCKRVDLPALNTVPAPPKRPELQSAGKSSPAGFPRIDSNTQKARDNDRRQILLDEMRNEEDKLAALKKEYNNGEPERRGDERNYAKYQERVATMQEDIGRVEKNIEALKRELGSLK